MSKFLDQLNGQVLMSVGIGILTILSAFSAWAAKMLKALKQVTDEVNQAVNCEPPGKGIKDTLRNMQTSIHAQATVFADHAATVNASIAELSGEVAQVRGEVNAIASRIITVEDKQQAYDGIDRRKPPTQRARVVKKTSAKKAG